MTHDPAAPLAVPCPTCGALMSEPCGWPDYRTATPGVYHLARLDLWGITKRRKAQDAPGATESVRYPGVAPEARPH